MSRAIKGYDALGNEVWRSTTDADELVIVALLAKAQTAIQTNIDALALPDPTSGNNTFLAIGSPNAAQQLAQLRALTNQNNAIVAQLRAATRQSTTVIRLLRGTVDSTDGT